MVLVFPRTFLPVGDASVAFFAQHLTMSMSHQRRHTFQPYKAFFPAMPNGENTVKQKNPRVQKDTTQPKQKK